MKKITKKLVKIFFIFTILVVILSFSITVFIIRDLRNIATFKEKYQTIKIGDNIDIVKKKMEGYTCKSIQNRDDFWSYENLSKENVVIQYQYSVSTFYLPITLVYAFNNNGMLIAKHSFD